MPNALERDAARRSALRIDAELRRIRSGAARLVAAGRPAEEAIPRAVESQMDEDERRRFPEFYHWRREIPASAGSWAPPQNPTEVYER